MLRKSALKGKSIVVNKFIEYVGAEILNCGLVSWSVCMLRTIII